MNHLKSIFNDATYPTRKFRNRFIIPIYLIHRTSRKLLRDKAEEIETEEIEGKTAEKDNAAIKRMYIEDFSKHSERKRIYSLHTCLCASDELGLRCAMRLFFFFSGPRRRRRHNWQDGREPTSQRCHIVVHARRQVHTWHTFADDILQLSPGNRPILT